MQFAVLIGHDLSKIHPCRCNPPTALQAALGYGAPRNTELSELAPGYLFTSHAPSLRKHDCAPGSDQVLDRPQ